MKGLAIEDAEHAFVKVRIMTWNMHGHIPKGDLEVLFGHMEPHSPENIDSATFGDEYAIPQLPMNTQHPFHLLVIACQECPWGDGSHLSTTLHTASELRSIARTRSRAAREFRTDEVPKTPAQTLRRQRSQLSMDNSSDTSILDGTTMPVVDSDTLSHFTSNEPSALRGWSKVCEDYFVRGIQTNQTDSPLTPASLHAPRTDAVQGAGTMLTPSIGQEGSLGSKSSTSTLTSARNETRSSSPGFGENARLGQLSPKDMRIPPLQLGPYELIIKERMMGCYTAVYVWRPCLRFVKGASANVVKTGLLAGRMGNKGGIGVSVHFADLRLLFINAHLAAHASKMEARVANINKIESEMSVDTFLLPNDVRNAFEQSSLRFDHSFWCGDLNFRVNITRKHADWLIMNESYEHALEFDQLRTAMREGNAFQGFKEAAINFPPTYKYDVIKAIRTKAYNDANDTDNAQKKLEATRKRKLYVWPTERGKQKEERSQQDRNAATLTRSESFTSLSNISDSSSIMEEVPSTLDTIAPEKATQSENTKLHSPKVLQGLRAAANSRKKQLAEVLSNPSEKAAYDSSTKQRVPSWCDRVLWRSNAVPKAQEEHHEHLLSRSLRDALPILAKKREQDKVSHDEAGKSRRGFSAFNWLHADQNREHEEGCIMKSEVRVLEYRTIEDADVQALGAISDHRPVIFSAMIGL
ncbi:hypothetical protein MVES1_003661 [Malassezia vespertilionis]|uniref:uncharacterized protein n=1 Tax=Malassezia vespertilionis TaxID=2020962 RepID=UPI0024B2127C|nr:uncharacterized protein MVES1_003661 [Malassezia vespertilionis]WFD08289.1 hypothetical protein MVES1_003661 [Malassezia vespertilionis]